MPNKLYVAHSLQDLPGIAKSIIADAGIEKVWRFDGEMGAGKTTFIKKICRELGVTDNVQSPTFSIVNEYITSTNEAIYHFDCYRLASVEEALNIGIEEYFYSGNYCFIEWAERIEELIPENAVLIKITENAAGGREIVAEF